MRLSRVVTLVYDFHCFEPVLWYGDGAGNTVEENSSVFSLIRMH